VHKVLISYSKKDKKWADAACSILEARGIRCWIAPRDIATGTERGEAVIAGIDASKVMLLMFSTFANESPRVRREVVRAISKELPVVACRIEDAKPAGAMKDALRNARWLDIFEPPVEAQLKRLANSVQALLATRVPKNAGLPPIPDVATVQRSDAGDGAVCTAKWRRKRGLVVAAGCTSLLLLAASLSFIFWARPRAASTPIELKAASNGQTASPAAVTGEVQLLDGESSQSPPHTVQQSEASPAPAPFGPKPSAGDRLIPLFNGKDLAGWTALPLGSENWRVDNGILTAVGLTQSCLYTERTDFKDFRLRVEARINDGGDSGVFFRSPSDSGELAPRGYEAHINSTHRDPNKTGSLYRSPGGIAASVTQTPIRPGEWFEMEISAIGKQISIKVNGKQTANFEDSEPHLGRIGLQQHDPQTVVEFRRIEIKEVESQDALAASPKRESERRADKPADPDVGGPPQPGDQRTAPDRPAEDGNGRAPVAGNGGGQGRLSGEDLALLKAASNWYYDNKQRIVSDPWFNQSLDFIVTEAQSGQPRSTLARVMLVRLLLMKTGSKVPEERADMIRHLPKTILDLAVRQAMEEFTTFPGDFDYHGFLETAVFYGVEKWGNTLRRNEINKYRSAIVVNEATSNIAKNVERLYGPKLSTAVLDRQTFRGRLEYRDEFDFENKRKANGGKYPGGSLGIKGKFIALEYRGDTELTNVLLVGRLKTTGIVRELEPEQKNSPINFGGLAAMAGGGPFLPFDQLQTDEEVTALKLAMNMYSSMPVAVFNYIPKLPPGTTIRMVVSGIDNERYLAGGSATLYCDQGYLPEMEVNKFGFTAKKADGADPLAKGSVWEGDLFHAGGFFSSTEWHNPDKCRLIITDRKGDTFKGKILGVFNREEIAGRIVSHEIKWQDPGDRKIKGNSPVSFAGKITGDRMEVVGIGLLKKSRKSPQYKLVLQYTGVQP
jgi:hypothetical protein